MRVEDIKIEFAPVPPNTQWQVLVSTETTTTRMVLVDHADLSYEDDVNLHGLVEAVRNRALRLLEQGDGSVLGVETQPAEVTSWEQHGSAAARKALDHYTRAHDRHESSR